MIGNGSTSLKKLFADYQSSHSDFQMDNFITIASGGTPYGMYKQALRELHKRYRGLKGLYVERGLLELDIEDLGFTGEPTNERRRILNLTKKQMALEELDHSMAETTREFNRFYAQAVALKKELGELTEEKRRVLEEQMWAHKAKSMAAAEMLTTGSLSKATVELIVSFPLRLRTALIEDVKADNLTEWFDSHDAQIPNYEIGNVDVEKLIEMSNDNPEQ